MELEVLIVDDDAIITMIHKRLVVKSGLHANPQVFLNGKAALEYLKSENGSAAGKSFIVLLDINMPIMNGWQFMDSLQKEPVLAPVHVVMVTSSVDKSDREKASSYGLVRDYFEKPVDVEKLKNLVSLLGGG